MAKEKTFQLKDNDIFIQPTDPKNPWQCEWDICLKDESKERIGIISFDGILENGSIPIKIEIFEKYNRNKGYGTQAIRTLIEWAFYHKNVFEITAVCEHENDSCIMALQKAGFVYREGRDIESYSITKPKTSWMGLYAVIGIVAGMIVVAAIPSYPFVTFAVVMLISLCLGAGMDAKEVSYREKVVGHRVNVRKK